MLLKFAFSTCTQLHIRKWHLVCLKDCITTLLSAVGWTTATLHLLE